MTGAVVPTCYVWSRHLLAVLMRVRVSRAVSSVCKLLGDYRRRADDVGVLNVRIGLAFDLIG